MCQACDHPKRQALEQDIRAGMTSVRVTKTYGLRHHAVVMQHKRRHMLAIYASPLIVEDESQSQDAAFDVERVEASQSQSIALTVESAHNPQQAGIDLAPRQMPLMPSTSMRVEYEPSEACGCYWCQMSGYQRLLRAWQDANTREKERFCADTRTVDVPF